MTDRITEIEARLAAATPGEWRAEKLSAFDDRTEGKGYVVPEAYGDDLAYWRWPDADLVAHAPSDLAWLLGVARAARETLDWLVMFFENDNDGDEVIELLRAALGSVR